LNVNKMLSNARCVKDTECSLMNQLPEITMGYYKCSISTNSVVLSIITPSEMKKAPKIEALRYSSEIFWIRRSSEVPLHTLDQT